MKIVCVGGGLGNQIFQYIFARWYALKTGSEVYIDHSHMENSLAGMHNGFELDRAFPQAPLNLLKNQYSKDKWEEILKKTGNQWSAFPYHLMDEGGFLFVHEEHITYHADKKKYPSFPVKSGVVTQELRELSEENCYFFGFWIHDGWFCDPEVHSQLQKELTFAPLTEEHNLDYAQKIEECCSVSVHIRRGDFLDSGIFLGYRYYQQALKRIREYLAEEKNRVFFIFSDDLLWCKEHGQDLGFLPEENLVFVDGNQPNSGLQFRDMQLMSLCRHKILANSTFSLCACLLGEEKSYISPLDYQHRSDWVCHLV